MTTDSSRQPADPNPPEGFSIPGDVPDLRRDSLEEAAELSKEAQERSRDLDAVVRREADALPPPLGFDPAAG